MIKIDRSNFKAYYLRARSRILNTNSGIDELQYAIDDLREALVLNPNNPSAKTQLTRMKRTISKQTRQPNLSRFFSSEPVKSSVFNEKFTNKFNKPKGDIEKNAKRLKDLLEKKKSEFSFEVKEKRRVYPEIEEVRDSIKQSEMTIDLYMNQGLDEDAKKMIL